MCSANQSSTLFCYHVKSPVLPPSLPIIVSLYVLKSILQDGLLPLHLTVMHKADVNVVALVLEAYPDATSKPDKPEVRTHGLADL